MKRSSLAFIAIGISLILFSFSSDLIGVGKDANILGAAQIAGIELGVILTIIGVGLLRIKTNLKSKKQRSLEQIFTWFLDIPILFWLVITFFLLFIFFFISPVFFSEIKIQYFTKYIPNAWTPHIGFDIRTTVEHINAWLTEGVSPYADGIVPYTPFTLALFTPFIILGYPVYYKVLTLLTIISYGISTFLLPSYILRKKEYSILIFLGITGLFSYGFQFELERGQFNVIAFLLSLLAIYIFHYKHEYRFFAYIFFSIAVQLKLYPIIFIVMLVQDWQDWKNNIKRFVGLGFANFALLFVMGYQLFLDFIEQIGNRAAMQSSRYEDLSISGFSYYLSEEVKIISTEYAGVIEKILFILLIGTILAIIIHLYRKGKTGFNPYLFLATTIGALIIPAASFDYKLTILIVPMIILLSNLPQPEHKRGKILFSFLILLISLAYWSTLYPYEVNEVKPFFLSRNSMALLIIFFSTIPLYLLEKGKYHNISSPQE